MSSMSARVRSPSLFAKCGPCADDGMPSNWAVNRPLHQHRFSAALPTMLLPQSHKARRRRCPDRKRFRAPLLLPADPWPRASEEKCSNRITAGPPPKKKKKTRSAAARCKHTAVIVTAPGRPGNAYRRVADSTRTALPVLFCHGHPFGVPPGRNFRERLFWSRIRLLNHVQKQARGFVGGHTIDKQL